MTFLFNNAFLDAATPWQIGFQDPATPIIIGIIHFHNHLIFFLVVIGTFVCWLLYKALVLFKEDPSREASKFTHNTPLEVVWTITPALLLLLIAGPSFALLYSIDEVIAPHISLKVIGHQWYWSYEYSDYVEPTSGEYIKFDSYIVSEDDLTLGGLRLLEVDNRVKLPTNVHIRVLVSAADVLHSWAVPSLGIKIDACPGRLNQVSLFLIRKGVFYGQCSEICGVNHAFMPIVVESMSEESYLNWVKASLTSDSAKVAVSSGGVGVTNGSDGVGGGSANPVDDQKSPTPSSSEVDLLSLEWLKETPTYQHELSLGNDLIKETQEKIDAFCSPTGLEDENTVFSCKFIYVTLFKENFLRIQKEQENQIIRDFYELLKFIAGKKGEKYLAEQAPKGKDK